jgi:hypothetical protein
MKTNTIDEISKSLAKRTNRRAAFAKLSKFIAGAAATGLALRPGTAYAKKGGIERSKRARAQKFCQSYCESAVPMGFLKSGGIRDLSIFNPPAWITGRLRRLKAWRNEYRACTQACHAFVLTGEYSAFGISPVFQNNEEGDFCQVPADQIYELHSPAVDTCEGQPGGTTCPLEIADLFGGAAACYQGQCIGGVCQPVFSREGAVCIPDTDPPQDGNLYIGSCDTVREQCVWTEIPEPCGF